MEKKFFVDYSAAPRGRDTEKPVDYMVAYISEGKDFLEQQDTYTSKEKDKAYFERLTNQRAGEYGFEDIELYAEAPSAEDETGTYGELKAAILEQAKEKGVDPEMLSFRYDD
jgi:hypothetical protein